MSNVDVPRMIAGEGERRRQGPSPPEVSPTGQQLSEAQRAPSILLPLMVAAAGSKIKHTRRRTSNSSCCPFLLPPAPSKPVEAQNQPLHLPSPSTPPRTFFGRRRGASSRVCRCRGRSGPGLPRLGDTRRPRPSRRRFLFGFGSNRCPSPVCHTSCGSTRVPVAHETGLSSGQRGASNTW